MPDSLDSSVDIYTLNKIKFDLPGLEERERLVRLYFQKFILVPASQMKSGLKVDKFDYDAMFLKIAKITFGFSAVKFRDLGLAWQAATYLSFEGVLTENLMMKVVQEKLKMMEDIRLEREAAQQQPAEF